jgi:hypothetical protein
MERFEVNNELELGNAIWASVFGDNIVLNEGTYGFVPVKYGVNYEFINSSCSQLLGLGINMNGNWSAGSFENGVTKITNPNIIVSNIKMYYIYRTKLPFNSRFETPISFAHANGVIINILGNDKEGFEIGGFGQKGEDQLPKAIIDIIVPSLEGYDTKASENFYSMISKGGYFEFEINEANDRLTVANLKKQEIENSDINNSLGLNLNDFEYKALWAVNTFIKEYCRLFDSNKIKGFDVNEFKDGILNCVCESLDVSTPFNSQLVIGEFTNVPLQQQELIELSNRFLSFQEYSISDYTIYHLNHLNYSFATIGIYQEFEFLWENTSPKDYKLSNLNQKDKFAFIDYITHDINIKKYLAEMINARNWITHSKKIITKDNSLNKNKLKTDWNAEVLNEYQIYALKRPFFWFKALNDFKIEFNIKFPS